MKIELGGGTKPKPGFTNLDIVPTADIQIDLMQVCLQLRKLPFPDDSVDEIYSSHFWEHIDYYQGLLHELARVCKIGGKMEMRVPHWGQPMAMCAGHKHVMSEDVVRQWEEFRETWWSKQKKMFHLMKTDYTPHGLRYTEAKTLFPHFTDRQIYTFVPGTCHEIIFNFVCQDNHFFKM